jgi:branched-chain amino acid transport system substrate-binding protein
VVAGIGAAALMLAACSSSGNSASGGPSSQSGKPIKIGVSLSLSGDFSADGKAFQQGYKLWADDINSKGGLLGRQVKLDIVNDASSPV